ncbi:tripartite motif-containing protein 16-like [Sebastes fasciatus]|uniref:tripartite motif-containing protein 16-like n=1 Tax=Sebastes fasciatus TaxID=394691 RepID=UPI003D9F6960
MAQQGVQLDRKNFCCLFCQDLLKDPRGKKLVICSECWHTFTLDSVEDDKMTVDVLLPQPEPKTRAGFLRYSRDITLDPNTAQNWLSLSEGNRKVTLITRPQTYPPHQDRFCALGPQVLSRESLTGRCYWEVKWTGKGIYIAVAYKTISRDRWTGEDCTFGFNDKSWSLYCFEQKYGFIHNGTFTRISGPLSSRVGVYLDHSAGILSFYSVSETMTLLHRVQTTFTEPLYAGLGPHRVSEGDTAEFCKLK